MKDYLMLWNQTKEELKKSIHENTFNQIVSSITEVHCVRNNIIYLIVKIIFQHHIIHLFSPFVKPNAELCELCESQFVQRSKARSADSGCLVAPGSGRISDGGQRLCRV